VGLSSKKTSSTTNQTTSGTTSSTTTPTNPAWVDSGLAGLGSTLSNLGSMNPSSFVAGPNALQTQAGTAASNLTSSPDYSTASGILNSVAGQGANTYSANTYNPTNAHAASLLDNLGAYMNPYTNDVVNTTLAGFDKNADMTRATQSLAEAKSGAFGGSGAALTRSLTEGELAQQRASTEAGLRDQAFNTGANLSNLDAGRRQDVSLANANAANSAGQFNAGALNTAGQFNAGQADNASTRQLAAAGGLTSNATAFGNDARSNATTQGDIGSILQQIQQNQAGAPLATAGTLASIYNTLPLSLLHGGTTNGTASGTMSGTGTTTESGAGLTDWLNMIAKVAPAAIAASDGRLKQDIETVGYDAKGRRWVDYAYVWDPETRHRGVIAQEVQKTDPDAVMQHPMGFLMVDYSKLGEG
jgi:hypothetical protein